MQSSPVLLQHIILYSTDIRVISSFYQKALGLGDATRQDQRHIGFQLSGLYLGFEYSDVASIRGSLGFTPWFTVEDLFTVFARCKQLGAKVRMEPERKERGAILAALVDPQGHVFGIHQQGT